MTKLKIKSGDVVTIIAGDHKGEQGKVVRVNREKNNAIVEGINMVSKHTKPSAKKPSRRYYQERSSYTYLKLGFNRSKI